MPDMGERYGLLLASMDAGTVSESEIDAWYGGEHIPERLQLPGVLTGAYFKSLAAASRYLAIYDLQTVDVLESAGYLALRNNPTAETTRILAGTANFRRGAFVQIAPGTLLAPPDARALVIVEFACTAAMEEEINAWYETEHLPQCAAVSGVLAARRFQDIERKRRYLTLYHLTSPAVLDNPEWRAAGATPWSRRILPRLQDLAIGTYLAS